MLNLAHGSARREHRMSLTKRLERLANAYLPPAAARLAKRVAVHPRYRAQATACREGYRLHADRYPQKVLFVAGLPKSGTTWLERMLASYPGFHDLMIPDVAAHEMASGGSHDYDLPEDIFRRFDRMLVLTKMHVHGSAHNARLLADAGVRCVILFRDLRDVAVSYCFYVQRTVWHPDHPAYRGLEIEAALRVFGERLLPEYAAWVLSWEQNRDPDRSLIVRYEDMLADTRAAMKSVAALYELDDSDETIGRIVDQHSFARLKKEEGPARAGFFRKGVSGDWVNHFTPELRCLYKEAIGGFLVRHGYEESHDW
jgi:hypothetical protein